MDQQVARVFVASGEMEAQQVRAFLEAAGVSTIERGEALRNTHGLTLGGLGAVEIFVPSENADEARELLEGARAQIVDPRFSQRAPWLRPEDYALRVEGLRLAIGQAPKP